MVIRRMVLAGVALLALGAAACGGDDEKDFTEALAALGLTDLPVLVLPQDDLGDLADDMEIDPDSGETDNATSAASSLDPEDSAAGLREGGRLGGYSLDFAHPEFTSRLGEGDGSLQAGSEVELFEDAEAAEAAIAQRNDDLDRFEGQVIDGVELVAVEFPGFKDLGDESGALTYQGRFEDLGFEVYQGVGYVRYGPLVGAVSVARADDDDLIDDLEDAVEALSERFEAYLEGELEATPIAIPAGDEAGVTGGERPSGVPELDRAALRLSDLPDGFAIEEQGYDAEEPVSFERTFENATGDLAVAVGGTGVVNIQSTVELHESAGQAAAFFVGVAALLESEAGEELFAQAADGEIEGIELETEELDIGDEAVAVTGVAETSLVDFQVTFLVTRVEQLTASVIVVSLLEDFDLDDLVPLLEAVAGRLEPLAAD